MTRSVSGGAALVNFDQLDAPTHWRTVDILSDVHLNKDDPATFALWQQHMDNTPAQAVLLLGDWFDLWIGDDVLATPTGQHAHPFGFEHEVVACAKRCASRLSLHVMVGNRDFLMGDELLNQCGARHLNDPTVLAFGPAPSQRVLLSHGDALCTDDVGYMAFRQQARSKAWEEAFLAQPMDERVRLGRQMRSQSAAAQALLPNWVDVNPGMVDAWMAASRCEVFIHGHTHEGKTHRTGRGGLRWVTTDWHANENFARAPVLRIAREAGGIALTRVAVAQAHASPTI